MAFEVHRGEGSAPIAPALHDDDVRSKHAASEVDVHATDSTLREPGDDRIVDAMIEDLFGLAVVELDDAHAMAVRADLAHARVDDQEEIWRGSADDVDEAREGDGFAVSPAVAAAELDATQAASAFEDEPALRLVAAGILDAAAVASGVPHAVGDSIPVQVAVVGDAPVVVEQPGLLDRQHVARDPSAASRSGDEIRVRESAGVEAWELGQRAREHLDALLGGEPIDVSQDEPGPTVTEVFARVDRGPLGARRLRGASFIEREQVAGAEGRGERERRENDGYDAARGDGAHGW